MASILKVKDWILSPRDLSATQHCTESLVSAIRQKRTNKTTDWEGKMKTLSQKTYFFMQKIPKIQTGPKKWDWKGGKMYSKYT